MRRTSTPLQVTALALMFVPLSWSQAGSSSWLPISASLNRASVHEATLAPSQPTRVFAITRGNGLYRSDDRGVSWTDLTQSLPAARLLATVAVSPDDPDLVLLGGEEPGTDVAVLYRSTDGGESWASAANGIVGKRVAELAFDPFDPSIVYAGTTLADPSGVFRSDDAGLTWTLTTGALGDVPVHALVVDPFDPDRIVAAVTPGCIRSTDGGESWVLHPTVETFLSISASPVTADLYYASGNDGVYKSTDGGVAFSPTNTPSGFIFHPIVADPHASAGVFVGGSDFCGGFDSGTVWRSADGGSSWIKRFQAPEPDCGEHVRAILLDPGSASLQLIATEGRAGIFSSTNGGASWAVRNAGIHTYGADYLRVDGAGRIYARDFELVSLTAPAPDAEWTTLPAPFYALITAFEPSRGAAGLLYECGQGSPTDDFWPYMRASTDGGGSWYPALGDLPDGLDSTPWLVAPAWDDRTAYVFAYDGIYRSEDVNGTYMRTGDEITAEAAVVDPTDADRLYVASRYDPVVSVSTDRGATWEPRAAGLPNKPCVHLEIDPADPLHLLVVFSESGAWETTDGGDVWENVFPFGEVIRNADWDPVAGHVYLGTQGSGVVTNDARVTDEGAVTVSPEAIVYVDAADALVMSTGNGLYYQLLPDPASVDGTILGASPLQIRVAPNPADERLSIDLSSSARWPLEAKGGVRVHDVRGRRVRVIEGGAPSGTGIRLWWDLRDAQGRPVPAGTYFIRAEVANAQEAWRASRSIIVTR